MAYPRAVASYQGDPDRFPSTEDRYCRGISLWIAISLSPGDTTHSDTGLHGDHPAAAAIATDGRQEISRYTDDRATPSVLAASVGLICASSALTLARCWRR